MGLKTIRIKQDNFLKLIQEEIEKFFLKEASYHLDDNEKLMEYMLLDEYDTGLNVEIFVDDNGSYRRDGHPLLLFARNSNDYNINDFIPFLISDNPKILDDTIEINISDADILAIKTFIILNLNLLVAFANEEIPLDEFVANIQKPSLSSSIHESKELLNEMATLQPYQTNLPMPIWVDESNLFQGHAPRIKFKASKEQRTTREYTSMILTNPPRIENMPKNPAVGKRDIEKLERFVIENLELLLKLAKHEINLRRDFIPQMKKAR